ncbi:PepSY domain-containing protein [Cucumibacter marinus]|uniref:PepSY domain-containing protein n=1 Tax=Cucumibacter marinus TaxID=1121252 RepID=UPI00040B1F13|nr:PepSY domain-containing protein [Cucumibacter marinus]
MLRRLHSLPGLAAALFVILMSVTGAVLSLDPLIAQIGTPPSDAAITTGDLAADVVRNLPGVERITRSASGAITAYAETDTGDVAGYAIDPATGTVIGEATASPVMEFFKQLHRSMFLGTGGRALAGIAAAAMVILALSGVYLLVRRLGGWRKVFAPAQGTLSQRLHVEGARIAVAGLLLSAMTGFYMALVTFGLVPDGSDTWLAFPDTVDGGQPAAIDSLTALQSVPLSQMRELVFPFAGDTEDVFTLITANGQGFVDQATGQWLVFEPNSLAQSFYQAIYTLHTGQGMAWLGLVLGLLALVTPLLAVTGTLIWYRRQRATPRIKANTPPARADMVILVGSEGNSTWGFAAELHARLTATGIKVHTASMNAVRQHYPNARLMFALTSTYGDGAAPHSANRFLARLADMEKSPVPAFCVLGFGDQSFPRYCAFAEAIDQALAQKGSVRFQPLGRIDRQSAQAFADWGRQLGDRLRLPLTLDHVPPRPRSRRLVLAERLDYGHEVQAPTTVLRFASSRGRLPRAMPGDLLAILPPGSVVPRYYSVASSSRREGVIEICVRKQRGGLCSEFLHALEPGETVEAFVKPNPAFRPAKGKKPIILVGAGAGIAPLMGFVRGNPVGRAAHLYWGGRDPQSDFLYRDELAQSLEEGRLTRLGAAFSRVVGGGYVQDELRRDADRLRRLIADGAQILVCGGRDMGEGVRAAFDEVLEPLALSTSALRAEGRYLEDVY